MESKLPNWAKSEAGSVYAELRLGSMEQNMDVIARALVAAERRGVERAAKVAEGELYHERYRTWPWWRMTDGCGNRSNESELVKHADAIAAAIRQIGGEG